MSGTNIVQEKRANYTLTFLYDGSTLIGFNYKAGSTNADYYYGIDNFGNINYIYDSNGNIVVTYRYDAWGNAISTTGSLASTIGAINPYRYKSYYFDNEINMYYLQSRYYDASVQRFISEDKTEYLGTNNTIYSYNLYIYCNNNPISDSDEDGTLCVYILAVGFQLSFTVGYFTFGVEFLYSIQNKKIYIFAFGGGSLGVPSNIEHSTSYLVSLSKSMAKSNKFASKLKNVGAGVYASFIIVLSDRNGIFPNGYTGYFDSFAVSFNIWFFKGIISAAIGFPDGGGTICSIGIGVGADTNLGASFSHSQTWYILLNGDKSDKNLQKQMNAIMSKYRLLKLLFNYLV